MWFRQWKSRAYPRRSEGKNMTRLLDRINSPEDLKCLPKQKLPKLAEEIRETIIGVVSKNPGHLSSNLGVVELTLALHYCFDFKVDRLTWDVGHQCYVHKLLTGRREAFHKLRQYKGLSGFPDRKESPVYDPFTCGHSGNALSSSLGLSCGDIIQGKKRKIVVVVGDGGIVAGMSLEALNHAGDLKKDILVVLNDNKLAISETVGAFSKYFTQLRTFPLYTDLKKEVHHILKILPVLGRPVENVLEHLVEAVKRGMTPGQIFTELGFQYYGPVDGHNVELLINTINRIKDLSGPVLLHAITEKGKGFEPASENPTKFHSAGEFQLCNGKLVEASKTSKTSYTKVFGQALVEIAQTNPKIVAITAAMPDGTGLTSFREKFPDRYFDVGICEQHAVGLSSGLAYTGLKPVAAIYSTFLQRAYDQVFHDVCLQERENAVVFCMDRAGLVGNDGPTHHGVFDIAYLMHLPGIILMAPKDGRELKQMLRTAVEYNRPVAIRYPKDDIPDEEIDLPSAPISIGVAEVLKEGSDGAIMAYGAMVYPAYMAAEKLSAEGIEAAVINARFAKPLDKTLILELLRDQPFVLTVEDHALAGGFGSSVLEMVSEEQGDASKIRRMGIPDRFIEQGPRKILLGELGLDAEGIYKRFMLEWERAGSYRSLKVARRQ
jgi:1-deoxy-D-xylulose-5-phosphate synthase